MNPEPPAPLSWWGAAPSQYSNLASSLLAELGIDRTRYFQHIQPAKDRYQELGLKRGTFFDEQTCERNFLAVGLGNKPLAEVCRYAPLSQKARDDLVRITGKPEDYLPGLSPSTVWTPRHR